MGSLFSQLAGVEPYARLLTDLRNAPGAAEAFGGFVDAAAATCARDAVRHTR